MDRLLIKEGLEGAEGHAERLFALNIWWPVVWSFDGLQQPGYEYRDHNDKRRFLDYVYIIGGIKVAVELDGFAHTAAVTG